MLSKDNFKEEHIRQLQEQSHRDPSLLERTVYAFGLLEALINVNLPFIFKGGTCLMLLLEHPMRLSTDIDIIVKPGTDIDSYIRKASELFPFKTMEEQLRVGRNNIVKRHFKFMYDSPVQKGEFYILLDVLFEENNYPRLSEVPVNNDLLIVDGNPAMVSVPAVECILGDKLTAFAPHTTGIPADGKKDLEVMKQFYDICTLIDVMHDFALVRDTYFRVSESEIGYRGNDIRPEDALIDTFKAAVTIASRGNNKDSDYQYYLRGSRDVKTHVFSENFGAELASVRAPKLMYMAACLLANEPFEPVDDSKEYTESKFENEEHVTLKALRKANPEAYAYAIKADRIWTRLKQK